LFQLLLLVFLALSSIEKKFLQKFNEVSVIALPDNIYTGAEVDSYAIIAKNTDKNILTVAY
jgi:hypothetical protein